MIRKQIIATSGVDRQNQSISIESLIEMTTYINENNTAIRLGVGHDPTILPIGKIVSAKMTEIANGEFAIEAQIDEFLHDFKKCVGPYKEVIYTGESKVDSRPFIQNGQDSNCILSFSFNPLCFQGDDYNNVKSELESYGVQVEESIQKAISPELQLIITSLGKLMILLITRKSIEKITDVISDDAIKIYDNLKKGICCWFSSFKDGRQKVIVLSAPEQPIELVVCSDNAELVMRAYEDLEKMEVSSMIQSYEAYLNEKIDKIQFLYTAESMTWKLNYLTTKSGKSIGTEHCYKRAVKFYKDVLNSKEAGFSIGGSAVIKEENN